MPLVTASAVAVLREEEEPAGGRYTGQKWGPLLAQCVCSAGWAWILLLEAN